MAKKEKAVKVKLVSKLSVRSVCGGVDVRKFTEEAPAQELMTIIGIAKRFKAETNDKGDYIKFMGQFQGVSCETGEVFRSGVCFLPNVAANLLSGIMAQSEDVEIKFGFKIIAKYDDTVATKYIYEAESLIEAGENDPLKLLAGEVEKE